MQRTTINDLNTVVRLLNQNAGVAENQPGSYILAGAYGGWQLQRIVGSGHSQGVVAIFSGYRPKRELLDLIHAYRAGMNAAMSPSIPI
jgi:hypothetical protein